tara:strand:- start:639 stop:866 length:228 start_codon:yes stop_codon:yes gene_type:complete
MPDIRVRVGQAPAFKVVSSISGSSSMSLAELSDMNITGPTEGMVLVYNATTNKWDATLDLTPGTSQNLDINGGSF